MSIVANIQLYRVTCDSSDVVYHIGCPCANSTEYVGSTHDMKVRWSGHKSDMRCGRWTACGLTRHFQQHHQADMEQAISSLQVTLLDRLVGPHSEERLLNLEQGWMRRLGTTETGCNSRVELLARNRRNWGQSWVAICYTRDLARFFDLVSVGSVIFCSSNIIQFICVYFRHDLKKQ